MKKFLLIFICVFVFNQIKCHPKNKSFKINLNAEKLSNCKAKLEDSSIIDLSSLKDFSTTDKSFKYTYSPCNPITCSKSQTSSMCQATKDGIKSEYNLGELNTVEFDEDKSTIKLIYQGDDSRITNVLCGCSDSEGFEYVNEYPPKNYQFKLSSICCCPDKCNGKKPSNGNQGLSFGSILLIIFFSLTAVYLIGGIIFLKFLKNKNGTEIIPNFQFWTSIPSDIKSGVSFSVSKIKGNRNSYNQI